MSEDFRMLLRKISEAYQTYDTIAKLRKFKANNVMNKKDFVWSEKEVL